MTCCRKDMTMIHVVIEEKPDEVEILWKCYECQQVLNANGMTWTGSAEPERSNPFLDERVI